MVWTGPVGRVTPDGRSIHEVVAEVTDDDLDWLNRHSMGVVRYERAEVDERRAPDARALLA